MTTEIRWSLPIPSLYGSYLLGIEVEIDEDGTYHHVMRPTRVTEFLGYGLLAGRPDGVAISVEVDGPPSQWRSMGWRREGEGPPAPVRIIPPPLDHQPWIQMPRAPDDDCYMVGEAIVMPGSGAPSYMSRGGEIHAAEAWFALEAYQARQSTPATVR